MFCVLSKKLEATVDVEEDDRLVCGEQLDADLTELANSQSAFVRPVEEAVVGESLRADPP